MNVQGLLALVAAVAWASDASTPVKGSGVVTRLPTVLSLGPPIRDPVHPAVLDPTAPALEPEPGPKTFAYDPSIGAPPAPSEWTEVLSGDGHRVRRPRNAWGTATAVASLLQALERYHQSGLADVTIGDMSKEGGGPLKPHKSHQFGRDVDLSFDGTLPLEPTAKLLQAFLLDDNVGAIFLDWNAQREVWHALALDPDLALGVEPELQYPLAKGTGRTRIRHWPGHKNHIHVRFIA